MKLFNQLHDEMVTVASPAPTFFTSISATAAAPAAAKDQPADKPPVTKI